MPRPLTFLCSSTAQWNPGDEWIFQGIKHLFQWHYAARPINWVLYDRSPDSFTAPWRCGEKRAKLLGNACHTEFPEHVDAVVVAGTPEWFGPHMEPLFARFGDGATPFLFLGIGYYHENVELNPCEKAILQRAFVTARDEYAVAALAPYGVEPDLLPCPALFSAPLESPSHYVEKIALVLQSDRVPNQNVSTGFKERTLALARSLAGQYAVTVVCNYIDEFREFAGSLDLPVLYRAHAADYFEQLLDFDLVVSTRLHSAIAANSMLKLAVILEESPRVRAAAAQFPFLYPATPEDAPAVIAQLRPAAEARRLLNWKRLFESRYLETLAVALRSYGLNSI